MPAAANASNPTPPSSKPRHFEGSTPIRDAASRNMSGAGCVGVGVGVGDGVGVGG